jgi:hypothetical protein
MQRLAILLVLVVGVVGVVASTPGPSGDITGTSNTVSLTLDADNPSEEHSVDATVSASAPIESGSIRITADFSGSSAQVHMSVASSSESSDVDVIDTEAQPSVELGVAAFDGCNNTDCDDTVTVTFDLESDGQDPVTIDFTADGGASAVDDGSGEPVDGSLDLTAN